MRHIVAHKSRARETGSRDASEAEMEILVIEYDHAVQSITGAIRR
jgi:hypothetical protein